MTTPTIRSLDVRAVRLPMPMPHRTAGGTVTESPHVLALVPTVTLVRDLAPMPARRLTWVESKDDVVERHRVE